MFFRRHLKLGIWVSSILLLLIVFYVSPSYKQQTGADTSVNLRKPDNQEIYDAYKAISYTAMGAFMKHLIDPNDTEELEKLVVMSNDFITAHPSSERVDKVYYYLGKASVKLGRVEQGIAALQKLIRITAPDYVPGTRFPMSIGDAFRWRSLERGLLELGLAYDKQKAHGKADAVYKKLIAHAEFAGGMQAGIAKQILDLDTASRIGEVPKKHNGWIGQIAPRFEIINENPLWREFPERDSWHYRGKVVLLYYGVNEADTQSLNLKVVYSKYKDKRFRLITANADASKTQISDPLVRKRAAWIHYYDLYGQLMNRFQIHTLPAVFLMDANGVVQKTDLDEEVLEKAVDELVKENLATYDDPRTQKIVAKAVEAHGGLEKLKVVENIVYNDYSVSHLPDGSTHIGGVAKMYLTRDRFRVDGTNKTGVQFSRIYDGTAIYNKKDEGTFKQVPERNAKFTIEFYKDIAFREPIWLLVTLAQNEIPIQYVGTEKVKDGMVSVLRIWQPSGIPLKIFISEKTGYIVQFVREEPHVNRVTSLEQYKDVEGIKISHHWIQTYHERYETVLTNISFNAEIDPKLFEAKK